MRLRRLLAAEQGIALILAIGVMVVLAASVTAAISYATSNEANARTSKVEQVAYSLAEAGINNANAILNYWNDQTLQNNATDPTLLHPQPPTQNCSSTNSCDPFTQSLEGGTVTWYGNYDGTTNDWTITSTGKATLPTGGTLDRTITATVHVVWNNTQPSNATVWNYVFANNTSDSSHCDTTLDQTVTINAPLYVAGNLCLKNKAAIGETDPNKPVNLTVLGTLGLLGQNGVGTDTSGNIYPISVARIGNGCSEQNNLSSVHPCDPNGAYHDDYHVKLDQSAQAINMPASQWQTYYDSANPGPNAPCQNVSGTPPTWDNDGSLDFTNYPNGSVNTTSSPFDLTPASSDYTCQGYAGGLKVGEISWNHTTKVLTVEGVMYLDGSATVTQSGTTYTGSATLYLSGTFTMGQQATFCATANCDFSSWDPNQNMLIVVAHGNDGSGNSVSFNQQAKWQGGVYATNNFNLGQGTQAEGPIIAGSISVGQGVTLYPLPTIEQLPIGAPGNPNVHAVPASPGNYSG